MLPCSTVVPETQTAPAKQAKVQGCHTSPTPIDAHPTACPTLSHLQTAKVRSQQSQGSDSREQKQLGTYQVLLVCQISL